MSDYILSKGIGGHHAAKGRTNSWLTPPEIVGALGPFDLDPAACVDQPWATASRHFTIVEDGLSQPWVGRVWLNPPYSAEINQWMAKMARHGDGIALTFARTETSWFQKYVFVRASAVLFIAGRINFYSAEGVRAKANAGGPSVLIAYGEENAERLNAVESSGVIRGCFAKLGTLRDK